MDKVDTDPDRIEHLKPPTVPTFALRSLQIVLVATAKGSFMRRTCSATAENRKEALFGFDQNLRKTVTTAVAQSTLYSVGIVE